MIRPIVVCPPFDPAKPKKGAVEGTCGRCFTPISISKRAAKLKRDDTVCARLLCAACKQAIDPKPVRMTDVQLQQRLSALEATQRLHGDLLLAPKPGAVARDDFDLTVAALDARISELAVATPEVQITMLPQIVNSIGVMLTTLKLLMEQVPTQGQHLVDAWRAIVDLRGRLDSIEAVLVAQGWRKVA